MKTVEIVKIKQERKTFENFPPLKVTSSYSIAQWPQEEIGYFYSGKPRKNRRMEKCYNRKDRIKLWYELATKIQLRN